MDAGDSVEDTARGPLLGTNAVRLEWCLAKTEFEKTAQRRGRKAANLVLVQIVIVAFVTLVPIDVCLIMNGFFLISSLLIV